MSRGAHSVRDSSYELNVADGPPSSPSSRSSVALDPPARRCAWARLNADLSAHSLSALLRPRTFNVYAWHSAFIWGVFMAFIGSALWILGFMMMAVGAAATQLVGTLQGETPLPMAGVMMALVVMATGALLLLRAAPQAEQRA